MGQCCYAKATTEVPDSLREVFTKRRYVLRIKRDTWGEQGLGRINQRSTIKWTRTGDWGIDKSVDDDRGLGDRQMVDGDRRLGN